MTFTSLGRFRRRGRFLLHEALICIFTPVLAFILRGVEFDALTLTSPVVIYSVVSALVGFWAIHYVQLPYTPHGFVTSRDLFKIFKAAFAASMSGVIAVYFATRLQFVPRYVPIIHLFLFSGFLTGMMMWRMRTRSALSSHAPSAHDRNDAENQLMIGCGPLSVHYTALIDALPDSGRKIVGIVSISGDLVGASLAGRTILGPIDHMLEILNEFENHGVRLGRIVIATSDEDEQARSIEAVSAYCSEHEIAITLLSDLINSPFSDRTLTTSHPAPTPAAVALQMKSDERVSDDATDLSPISRYLKIRQRYDWILALLLAMLLSPFLILLSILTFFDVGRPVIFWQTRIGRNRHLVTIHKFRTLPHRGATPADLDRTPSFIGRFLQSSRLDELPQIFDVLERNLAFIGPRPLLPRDLPTQTGLREQVLPGITGWAQIHGGKQVSALEKIALDHWYLRHASPRMDFYILLKTAFIAIRGYEKRDDAVIVAAMREFYGAEFSRDASPFAGLSEAQPEHVSGLAKGTQVA